MFCLFFEDSLCFLNFGPFSCRLDYGKCGSLIICAEKRFADSRLPNKYAAILRNLTTFVRFLRFLYGSK